MMAVLFGFLKIIGIALLIVASPILLMIVLLVFYLMVIIIVGLIRYGITSFRGRTLKKIIA